MLVAFTRESNAVIINPHLPVKGSMARRPSARPSSPGAGRLGILRADSDTSRRATSFATHSSLVCIVHAHGTRRHQNELLQSAPAKRKIGQPAAQPRAAGWPTAWLAGGTLGLGALAAVSVTRYEVAADASRHSDRKPPAFLGC